MGSFVGRHDRSLPYEGEPQRSADIVNYRGAQNVLGLFTALLGLVALGTLAHALVLSAHHRQHEVALLKTLGFTRRQVRISFATQAIAVDGVAVAIGLPLGVAGGRELWSMFAHQIGVLPDPTTPLIALAIVAPLTAIVVLMVAAVPAR